MPVDEDDVIEMVDRLEAQDERRIAVVLEDDGGKERGLEAVRAAVFENAAETSQRRPSVRLVVVRELVQIPLDLRRGVETSDYFRSVPLQPDVNERRWVATDLPTRG